MRRFIRIPGILLGGLLLHAPLLHGQGFLPRFEHLTPRTGLSQDIVTCIEQDQEGFLWFGTEDGLNRYDGTSFRVFKNIPGDSTSLTINSIQDLLVTPDGTLWVAALGLNRYDPMTESFHRYSLEWLDPNAAARGGEVLSLCRDSTGSLWVGTTSSLLRITPDLRTVEKIRNGSGNDRSLPPSRVEALLCDRDGRVWIGTSAGLVSVVPELGGFTRVHSPAEKNGKGLSGPVTALFQDQGGDLWVGFEGRGVVRIDPESGEIRESSFRSDPEYRLTDDRVFAIQEDSRGRIWIGHFSGADVCAGDGRVISRLRHDRRTPSSIAGSRIYSIYRDRQETIWLGTFHGGASRYSPFKDRFRTYGGEASRRERVGEYPIYSIAERRGGGVWCGTESGVKLVDLPAGKGIAGRFRLPPLPRSPALAVLEDQRGDLWVAFEGKGGLCRVSARRGGERRYDFPPVRTLYEDRTGMIWIGLWNDGVIRLDPISGASRLYRSDDGSDGGLVGGGVWAIHEDRNGDLWMGTWGRSGFLNRFDRSTGRFTQFHPGVRDSSRIGGYAIRMIAEERDGSLWFGTWGMGLHRYDPGRRTFAQFYEVDGLPNSFIKGLLLDERQDLWISTERGLVRREHATGRFVHHTVEEGVQGDRFLSGSCARGSDGWLYFGGEGGLTYFHPDSIRSNRFPPPVVITAFRIFDRIQPRNAWAGGRIHLSHRDDFISFEFVGLDFTDPARIQYAYMLEGFDRGWVEAGTRRYAAYTHLDGGEYTFRVRAANSDGVWNQTGTTIRLIIDPPFWKTWWFIALGVLAGGGLLYGAYRIRIRQEVEMERLRQRIAGDLHDDIGTELSSIVIGSQILARTLPLGESDRTKVLDLGNLARRTHDMMRDIVWVLNTENGGMDEFVLKMRETAGRLLEGKDVTLDLPNLHSRRPLPLEVKRNLFLFYKECLNNIVRHANATAVRIRLEERGELLQLLIADNGRGFDQSGAGSGLGLSNLRKRAATLNASIRIDSTPGGGTAVTLTYPLT